MEVAVPSVQVCPRALIERAHRMGGMVFDRCMMEEVGGSQWIHSIRKRAKEASIAWADDLFLYWHSVSGKWVFAVWYEKPQPGRQYAIMAPLFPMDENPDGEKADVPPLDELMLRLQPVQVQMRLAKEKAEARERAEIEEIHNDNVAREDIGRWAKKRDEATGDMILKGRVPLSAKKKL